MSNDKSKISYCIANLAHMTDNDQKTALYAMYQNALASSDTDIQSQYTQNAGGTVVDLDKITTEQLSILYNFLQLKLN
jgi:hypothetical protein